MKRLLFTFFALTLFAVAYAVPPVKSLELNQKAGFTDAHGIQFKGMENLTYEDFLNHKPRELAKMTGQKLKFKERAAIWLVQKKLKKAHKKGLSLEEAMQESSSGFSWNWGAAILGLLLSLIGVIIAWIIWGKDGLISSLIGAAIWAVIFFVFIA